MCVMRRSGARWKIPPCQTQANHDMWPTTHSLMSSQLKLQAFPSFIKRAEYSPIKNTSTAKQTALIGCHLIKIINQANQIRDCNQSFKR